MIVITIWVFVVLFASNPVWCCASSYKAATQPTKHKAASALLSPISMPPALSFNRYRS